MVTLRCTVSNKAMATTLDGQTVCQLVQFEREKALSCANATRGGRHLYQNPTWHQAATQKTLGRVSKTKVFNNVANPIGDVSNNYNHQQIPVLPAEMSE
jgi:hypothetical protein